MRGSLSNRPVAAYSYDVVAYPGFPFAQTHPDRLATIATLMGMKPAAVERCRVLELACGDGGNLIPMAAALPGSTFVGVDLAKTAIASGNRAISALGLGNIRLIADDLMRVTRDWGEFDYVIAHGIYSWSSAEVQDHILRIARENLAPSGVAFVSYNALPGAHLRQMIREMLLYGPVKRTSESLALIRCLVSAAARPDAYSDFLREELERLEKRDAWALFHDELGEVYSPVYFHQFAAHARRHELQYLAEADFFESNESALAPSAIAALDRLATNRIEREQVLDFARGRRFRQTLLCHAGVSLNRLPAPRACRRMMASSSARALSEEPDFAAGVVEEFTGPRGARMKTAHPLAKLAMALLIARWPASMSFEDLHKATRAQAGGDRDLENILFILLRSGLIDLHRYRARLAAAPGPRPRVWKVARYQAARHLAAGAGDACFLTSLRHASVEISGRAELELVRLLNGKRDRSELLKKFARICDNPVPQLETTLHRLARAGLLDL